MAIVGFDTSILTSYYAARMARPVPGSMANPQSAASADDKPKDTSGVLPPWDARAKQPTTEQKNTKALSDDKFIALSNADLSELRDDGTAAADNARLYALYQAMNRLSTLASMASNKDAPAGTLAGLDRRFQSGLTEVYGFLDKQTFDNVTVIPGTKTDRVSTSVSIPPVTSTYVGGVAVKGDVFQAVPGLSASQTITITVTKNGVATPVAVDLSTISGTLSLDNIAAAFNNALAANGMVTRFHRVEIGHADPGKDKSFGLEIEGTFNEHISLSASNAQAAVYLAGTSGSGADQSGRLVKLTGVDNATLISVFSRDIAPDGTEATDAPKALTDAGLTVANSGGTANARASVVDAEGNVYVVGDTTGSFGNQIAQGSRDVFLRKYDSAGNVLWTRLLGASDSATGYAIALDPNGGVAIAGKVTGDLKPTAVGGGDDGFVAKYSADGEQTMLRQVAPVANDEIRALAVGDHGAIYLTGKVSGTIAAGQTNAGGADAFVTKLDEDGKLVYHRQFGTAGSDVASQIALTDDGGMIVASQENGHAIVRKYATADGTGAALWQFDLGDLQGGALGGIAVKDGAVYVSGASGNGNLTAGGSATVAHASSGGADAFVFRIDDSGATANANYVSYVGTAAAERAGNLTVTGDGVYLTGDTAGTFAGETQSASGSNAFVARLAADGSLDWAHQFGGFGGQSSGAAVVVDASGASALDALGLPKTVTTQQSRDLISQSTARPGDYFTMTLTDPRGNTRTKRITIDDGETFQSLSDKLNRVLLLDGKAQVAFARDGRTLKIEVNKNVQVTFAPGKDSFDALAGLGIDARVLVNDGSLLDKDTDDASAEKKKPVIGLDIEKGLSLSTTASAAHAASTLQAILTSIRTAYRTLNDDGALKEFLTGTGDAKPKGKQGGTVPAYLTKQISSYQQALQRLGGG